MNLHTAHPSRRVLPAIAGAVALLALGACNKGTTTAGPVASAPVSTPASATVTPPTPTVTPPTPAASPTPTTPAQPNVPACTATDLVARPTESGGAMGSVGYDVTLGNRGQQACSLSGLPVVWYTDAQGGPHKLPENTDGDATGRVVLRPGATAGFTIMITDGYGGYDPTSPACAHPHSYRDMSVQVPGGRVSLPDLRLSVQCGDIQVGAWS